MTKKTTTTNICKNQNLCRKVREESVEINYTIRFFTENFKYDPLNVFANGSHQY